MKYSIIIPTYKRDSLIETLSSIFSNCDYLNDIEIIIVDNDEEGSAKKNVDSFISKNLYYFVEEKKGVSYARNRGAKEASSDLFVFIDDDEYLTKLWFREILNYLDKEIFIGSILLKYEKEKPFWIGRKLENYLSLIDYKENKYLKEKEWISAGNLCISKILFNKIEGFRTTSQRIGDSLLGNEDIMLKKDAELLGFKTFYVHNMNLLHLIPEDRTTLAWFEKRAKGQGLSDVVFDKQYGLSRFLIFKIKYFLFSILEKIDFSEKRKYLYKISKLSKKEYIENFK